MNMNAPDARLATDARLASCYTPPKWQREIGLSVAELRSYGIYDRIPLMERLRPVVVLVRMVLFEPRLHSFWYGSAQQK